MSSTSNPFTPPSGSRPPAPPANGGASGDGGAAAGERSRDLLSALALAAGDGPSPAKGPAPGASPESSSAAAMMASLAAVPQGGLGPSPPPPTGAGGAREGAWRPEASVGPHQLLFGPGPDGASSGMRVGLVEAHPHPHPQRVSHAGLSRQDSRLGGEGGGSISARSGPGSFPSAFLPTAASGEGSADPSGPGSLPTGAGSQAEGEGGGLHAAAPGSVEIPPGGPALPPLPLLPPSHPHHHDSTSSAWGREGGGGRESQQGWGQPQFMMPPHVAGHVAGARAAAATLGARTEFSAGPGRGGAGGASDTGAAVYLPFCGPDEEGEGGEEDGGKGGRANEGGARQSTGGASWPDYTGPYANLYEASLPSASAHRGWQQQMYSQPGGEEDDGQYASDSYAGMPTGVQRGGRGGGRKGNGAGGGRRRKVSGEGTYESRLSLGEGEEGVDPGQPLSMGQAQQLLYAQARQDAEAGRGGEGYGAHSDGGGGGYGPPGRRIAPGPGQAPVHMSAQAQQALHAAASMQARSGLGGGAGAKGGAGGAGGGGAYLPPPPQSYAQHGPPSFLSDAFTSSAFTEEPASVASAMVAKSGAVVQRVQVGRRTISSRYRGVSLTKSGHWRVQVGYKGHRVSVGHFLDEDEAARAYDRTARALHTNPDMLNFPGREYTPAECKPDTNRMIASALRNAASIVVGGKGAKGEGGKRPRPADDEDEGQNDGGGEAYGQETWMQ